MTRTLLSAYQAVRTVGAVLPADALARAADLAMPGQSGLTHARVPEKKDFGVRIGTYRRRPTRRRSCPPSSAHTDICRLGAGKRDQEVCPLRWGNRPESWCISGVSQRTTVENAPVHGRVNDELVNRPGEQSISPRGVRQSCQHAAAFDHVAFPAVPNGPDADGSI